VQTKEEEDKKQLDQAKFKNFQSDEIRVVGFKKEFAHHLA